MSRGTCVSCGGKLQVCPVCLVENLPGDRFCRLCGHDLNLPFGAQEEVEVKPVIQEVLHQIVNVLKAKGVDAEPLEPAEYRHLVNKEMEIHHLMEQAGAGYVYFKLSSADIDMLSMMIAGSEEKLIVADVRYIVSGIHASRDFEAKGKVRKKGLFGLGAVAGFEWEGSRLADALNQDMFLRDFFLSTRHKPVEVQPDVNHNCVAIRTGMTTAVFGAIMSLEDMATFFVAARTIARHIR